MDRIQEELRKIATATQTAADEVVKLQNSQAAAQNRPSEEILQALGRIDKRLDALGHAIIMSLTKLESKLDQMKYDIEDQINDRIAK